APRHDIHRSCRPNGAWRQQSAAAAWRAPPLLWIHWMLQPWPPPWACRLDGETAVLECEIAEQSASDSLCNVYCTTRCHGPQGAGRAGRAAARQSTARRSVARSVYASMRANNGAPSVPLTCQEIRSTRDRSSLVQDSV